MVKGTGIRLGGSMRLSRSLSMQTAQVSLFVFFCSVTGAAQATSVAARVTQTVNVEKLLRLRGNTHPLARPEFDRGAAPDSLPMARMLLVLQRSHEQEGALRHLLDEQQIRSSLHFHQWLTPEQFGQQFGPADADIQALTEWLSSQGFQVHHVAAGRTVIEFSGTAGLVRQALHTEIHKFVVNEEEHWANATDPQIPAALAPVVAGIASLHNFREKPLYRRLGTFSRSRVTGEVRPLFTFTTSGVTLHAVGPSDFATIYNVLPLWNTGIDGTGQSIAIVGRSNINIQDVRDFRGMFGLPANDPQIILNGPDPGILSGGEEGEADLDVQWSGAVAKNATIKFVVSESTESTDGANLSALYVVDNNVAPVMSHSFGICEAFLGTSGNAFRNALREQAAAQGITAIVAAGDSGSAGCDDPSFETAAKFGLAVSGSASTPFNVAVGGTDFDDVGFESAYWNATNSSPSQSSAKSYIPETTWNDSCAQLGQPSECATVASNGTDLRAGSGGPSNCALSSTCGPTAGYPKPAWQTGTGVPSDGSRDIPDVSLFASDGFHGSFYVFCQMDANTASGGNSSSCDLNSPFQNFQGGGGTSFSAPAFAGIMALVNQKTGQRQGNPNYVLYKLAAQSGASCTSNDFAIGNKSCIFYDVNNRLAAGGPSNDSVACQAASPNCSNTSSSGFGIMMAPGSTSTPAWNTTAGYDLATGLGSVNAANLVNNWTSVTLTPSMTTLSLSTTPATTPITLTHGQSANVNIQVAPTPPATGTPTGDVSLIAQTNGNLQISTTTGVDFFKLASGAVSGTTNRLPGGTYSVTAHYAGDGTFGASDSTPPIPVTVNPEPSLTKIGLVTFDLFGNVTSFNATTAPYGSFPVLRVDVTNSLSQPCSSNPVPCPTGKVTVTDNGNPPPEQGAPPSSTPGSYTLNSQGYLEDAFVQFPPGSHNLVASYAGDNSYNGSTSPADPITITTAATTTTVSAPASALAGSTVSLRATVNTQSSGVAPTGTVTLFNGSTPISGTPTYRSTNGSSSGPALLQASLTTRFTAAASISAQYSGDSNYTGSTSTATQVTVSDFSLSAKATGITISAPGGSGTSTISVAPSGGFNGIVSFSCTVSPTVTEDPTCALSPTSVTGSGNTTLMISTTAPAIVVGPFNGPGWFMVSGGIVLVCLFLLAVPAGRRRLKLAFGLLFLALMVTAFVACGGGGGSSTSSSTHNPGTPAGNYTITVTATSATLSHTAKVPVTVQ
jgi:pro-kumamolisin-like protein/Big-like domain-containing protein